MGVQKLQNYSQAYIESIPKAYLGSIPQSEYNNLINFITDIAQSKLQMSETELNNIIDNIRNARAQISTNINISSLDTPNDTYNNFYKYAYLDLVYLFNLVDKLYSVLDGYINLSSSYLYDMKGEIDKLEISIQDLERRIEYGNNIAIITETFKNTSNFEVFNQSTKSLFADRDGTELSIVDIIHNNTSDMITLNVQKEEDMLHSKSGKTLGRIQVVDYIGIPNDTYNTSQNAIDNSLNSYWECTVSSDELLDLSFENFEAKGAYIKFNLKLPSLRNITEISITPYCIHPITICDILVDTTSIIPREYVEDGISSTKTITLRVHELSADIITIVIRQSNYIYLTKTENIKREEAMKLWNGRLGKYIESFTRKNNNTTPFEEALETWEDEIENWNKSYIRNRERGVINE
jgi:hypothetical protein